MKALNADPVEDVRLLGAGGGGGGGGRLPAICYAHLVVIGLLIGAALVFLAGYGFAEYRLSNRRG